MPPRPLTKFEIQKYFQNEPKVNDSFGHALIVLELNIFQKKLENSLEIKILQQISIETSIPFSNVCILLYWIYWFYVKR